MKINFSQFTLLFKNYLRKLNLFIKVFNEPVRVSVGPKVDAKNPDYKRGGGEIEVIKFFKL